MPLMGELFFSRLWGWCCSIAFCYMESTTEKSDENIQDKKEVHTSD